MSADTARTLRWTPGLTRRREKLRGGWRSSAERRTSCEMTQRSIRVRCPPCTGIHGQRDRGGRALSDPVQWGRGHVDPPASRGLPRAVNNVAIQSLAAPTQLARPSSTSPAPEPRSPRSPQSDEHRDTMTIKPRRRRGRGSSNPENVITINDAGVLFQRRSTRISQFLVTVVLLRQVLAD